MVDFTTAEGAAVRARLLLLLLLLLILDRILRRLCRMDPGTPIGGPVVLYSDPLVPPLL